MADAIQTEFPLHSLQSGQWVKLICGASYQDLTAIRSLALIYSLAGVDCIDMAADQAVVTAAREGMIAAQQLSTEARKRGFPAFRFPWLMISLNDGEDPHFRKAQFDATRCPKDCARPCESLCPAQAINQAGVINQRCYGCGRCLPVCPLGLISTRSHRATPASIQSLLASGEIDALELHTQVGHESEFKTLWQAIAPRCDRLKILAISCPGETNVLAYLNALNDLIQPLPCPLIWQTDGRPMSGDIGKGTTHAAIKFAQKVLASDLTGYVQLAGGTNGHTVTKLKELGLLQNPHPNLQNPLNQRLTISGIAYGSYARSLVLPILEELENFPENSLGSKQLEHYPTLLWSAVALADSLISPLKRRIDPN
ncbi:MAG: LdpA C-terminal domain-containing domain [Snowella sp.]|nr:LdpA C-terminal domain-containing domain [Snowella sp.]